MTSSKEEFNSLTQEDRRWDNLRSGDKHQRAKPYKRDKKKVNYVIDIEDTETEIEAD